MASHREKGACGSVLRADRSQLSAVAFVPNAKSRLKTLGAPVPQPDPQAVAWMAAEQNARGHVKCSSRNRWL